MLEGIIRPSYQRYFVDPLARQVIGRVPANAITLIAVLLGAFVPIAVVFGHVFAAAGLLLISGYCDCLDGTVARMQKKSSDFGTVFDICADRLVEFMAVYALYLVSPVERAEYCLWMLGSILLCVTSFLVVGIFEDNDSNKGFYYSPGLVERAEAFLFFIAMLLLPQWFTLLSVTFSLLVMFTMAVRLLQFYRQTS